MAMDTYTVFKRFLNYKKKNWTTLKNSFLEMTARGLIFRNGGGSMYVIPYVLILCHTLF